MTLRILLIILLFFFYACSSEDGVKTGRPEPGNTGVSLPKKAASMSSDIKNSPPRIVLSRFSPPAPRKGDSIKLEVKAEDSDGDIVAFEYEWSLGDVVFPGVSGNVLDAELSKGDKIFVRITPYDKKSRGTQIVNWVAVANSYPDISTELVDVMIKKDKCEAKINASDADGDELTYSLKKAPEGMTIDSKSGVINWDFKPGGEARQYELTVSVKDPEDAESELNISLEGCFPEGKKD